MHRSFGVLSRSVRDFGQHVGPWLLYGCHGEHVGAARLRHCSWETALRGSFYRELSSPVFGGDDRTFNPEAGIDNSRVHLYINPETLEFEVAINRTIMYLAGHVLVDSLSLFDPGQDIKVLPTPGGFMVEATFLNNFCQWRSLCPTIDIELFFNENSSKPGGYDA